MRVKVRSGAIQLTATDASAASLCPERVSQ